MFIVGTSSDAVNEYTLTGAYCIGTASFVDSFSVNSQESAATGVAFSKSGMKMFIVGNEGNEVNEYTLTVAWDVSTASFVDSFRVISQDRGAHAIAFSKSGKTMFIVGNYGDDVNEYTLTVAWDISTASFVDSFSVNSQDDTPVGIAFSKSGEKMFVVGDSSNAVHEYTLTAAWDVSTASFVVSFSVNSQEATVRDIWFDSSGKTMFIVGKDGDDVNVYKLTIAWDVSTASFVS
jgi:6-phosphogluconolactonase (cycloisomerase 2 family)